MVLKNIRESTESENLAYRLVEGPKGIIGHCTPICRFCPLIKGGAKAHEINDGDPRNTFNCRLSSIRHPCSEAIRGVSVDSPIKRLLELELIVVTGRAELPGRPIQYGTTVSFGIFRDQGFRRPASFRHYE